jgi:uncharacterized protein (TIGR02271 family)
MDERHTRASDSDLRNDTPRVAPLKDLDDYQVAEGVPDPRGWDVFGADAVKVGKVHDLIVDTGAMRTRYLDISLDKDAIGARDDRDVLVPVGLARLDDVHDHVTLNTLSNAQLAALPAFTHGEITRNYESSVVGALPAAAMANADTAGVSDYYANKHFDDRQFYGTRRAAVDATRNAELREEQPREARVTRSEEELDVGKREARVGDVTVNKHVDTEHVTQPVTARREEVTIERRPLRADEGVTASKIGDDTEVHIPVTEEQISVEKHAVPKEEIVVKKHVVTEDRNVEADLRKEHVDVERSGDARDAS